MAQQTDIVERLRATPLIQAPMAGVSTPQLAAAVSNAGALGSIGIGASNCAQARDMIRKVRALTAEPFHVNVFCHAPPEPDPERDAAWLLHLGPLFQAFAASPPQSLDEIYKSFVADPETADMLLVERPAVVSFHFGLPPREVLRALRGAGIYTLATATSVAEAEAIADAGVDALVAQGIEAGGHRGVFDPEGDDEKLPTSVLVRLLARRFSLPVIAAGGIMDGQGIRAALDLGAVAAQLGTAFILCPESSANGPYRAALKSGRAGSTRMTSAISGRPARGLFNRFMAHGEAAGIPLPAAYPRAYDAGKQLHALASGADVHEFAAQWAGQGAPLAREMPAAELVGLLMRELRG